MSRLIETIRLEDGIFENLDYHAARMTRSRLVLFKLTDEIPLDRIVTSTAYPTKGLFKCRVIYDSAIQSIEYVPYHARTVKTLKIIENNFLEYKFKYEDRSSLKEIFDQRGEADDVIIVKNGLVTDASYANLIFLKGSRWYTPRSYLLAGTMRQYLLDKKMIQEETIALEDIRKYESVKLINAMLKFDSPAISTEHIIL